MTAVRASSVDPRFEARRAAVERSGRRRRRQQLIAAIGAVLLALAVYGATRSALLDVDQVQVVGAQRTGAAAAVAASGISRGSQLVDLDAEAVERRLERLPWVRSARVARSWPGTVRISLVERRPVAAVEAASGGWFLVDGSGRLVSRVAEPTAGLVVIEGLLDEANPGQSLVALAAGAAGLVERFGPHTSELAQRIRFVGDREVQLVLRDPAGPAAGGSSAEGEAEDGQRAAAAPVELVVELGQLDRTVEKLVSLDTVLAQVDLECATRIDVRVAQSPTVSRDPLCPS